MKQAICEKCAGKIVVTAMARVYVGIDKDGNWKETQKICRNWDIQSDNGQPYCMECYEPYGGEI